MDYKTYHPTDVLKFKITDIQWDLGEEVDPHDVVIAPPEIETEFTVEEIVDCPETGDVGLYDEDIESFISEWLSNTYGYCHEGFKFETVD